ncbi:hypothetical protein M3Y99_01722600 [Aphelenchoides fujianensis]|nr:hypothetical protein M3Y99_01722600 [Aphelenchoides fujianensis]
MRRLVLLLFFLAALYGDPATCSEMVGYYEGLFANPEDTESFTAQFQLTIVANTTDQNLYIYIDHLNTSDNIYCPFRDVGPSIRLHVHKEFPTQTLIITIFDGPFDNVNGLFTLNDPVGACTNSQIPIPDYDALPDSFFYCVCCEAYTPATELACPSDGWLNITCSDVVGFYTGIFTRYAIAPFAAEFQFEMHSNATLGEVTGNFDYINAEKTPDQIFLHMAAGPQLCTLGTPDCTAPFGTIAGYFVLHIHHNSDILEIITTEFEEDLFVVKNVTGHLDQHVDLDEHVNEHEYRNVDRDQHAVHALNPVDQHAVFHNPSKRRPVQHRLLQSDHSNKPEQVKSIVINTTNGFESITAKKADVYELSHIFSRVGSIPGIFTDDFTHVYNLYDKILNISENTLLLTGLNSLMSLNDVDLDLTHGENVGLTRMKKPSCEKHAGFADYGDSFGPSDRGGFLASIEIPVESLCDENDAAPIYYAIYRNVNIFVPNSTDEASKKHHLVSGFAIDEEAEESGKTFDPEKEPPKYERCAVGFHQNRNRVLSATMINKTLPSTSSKTMAVLRYRKEGVRESLHGNFKVTWWDGNEWSQERYCGVHTEGDFYVALCPHLTDFTLLVDGAQTDPILCDKALSAVGYTVNSGSILSLLLLNIGNAFNFSFAPLRALIFGLFIAAPGPASKWTR